MRGLTRRWWVLAASGVLVAGVIGQAAADPTPSAGGAPSGGDLISGLLDSITGHDDAFRNGCRNNVLGPADDASSAAVPLPFHPNFFGARNQLFVNNNGNVTFGAARPDYHFDDLSKAPGQAMIAPFLADVDTRDLSHPQSVTYGVSSDQKTFCADWGGVGYYNNHGDQLDKFRLLLIDRSGDQGNSAGDFDIVMDYNSIRWDKADAKVPSVAGVARVGYTAGSGAPNTSFQLPGSGTPGAFLDNGPNSLAGHSLATSDQRVTTMQNGRYLFAVRGGQPLPAGQPPVVPDITVHTAEDTVLHVNVPTSDPEGDVIVLRSSTDGAHGTVTCTGTAPIQCTYTPAANFHGTDAFRVNVTDSHGNSATGTVNVVVDPVNDAPTVVSPQSLTVSLTNPPTPVTRNVLTGASDPDGDTVTLTSLAPTAAHGTVACTAAGQCTYTPNATFTTGGTDSFTFTASDGNGGTATGTVNVAEHNDPPAAAFQANLQTPNTPLVVAFDASASHDPQGPIATYAWDFGDGSTGTGVNPTHTYAQPGTYRVKLTVTDSGGLTASTTRSVRLRGANGGGNNGPGGGGNNGPGGGGNNGPGQGPGGGPRDHGPGRGPDDHGRGGYGPGHGGNRDYLELVNDTGHGYSVHGTPRHGDFRIEREGDHISRISGTGYFDDGSSVTFRLRVRHDHAFGTITVRDRDRVLDRFRVDGVRITEHGDTVEGRARYSGGGGRFYFVIEDRY